MKTVTLTAIGLAAALVVAACALFEDRLARVTSSEFAAVAVDAGCHGGREFIEAATTSLDPTAASLLVKGVEAACALRAERTPVSAVVFDHPLDSFCAETSSLGVADAPADTRAIFNARRDAVCSGRL